MSTLLDKPSIEGLTGQPRPLSQPASTSDIKAIPGLATRGRIWFGVMLNEVLKGLIIRWSYRFNLLTEMFMFAFIFIGISFFMGRGSLDPSVLPSSLLGYLIWFFSLTAISNMSWNLREEAQSGTLEQMYMSPAPIGLIQIGRTLSTLLITTVMVGLVSIALILWLDITIPMRLAGIPIFLLTMMGLYGFGFIIGGATLLFKQVEALANLTQNMLLFLNGALLPVENLPGWLQTFALTLPTTQGIIVLRRVVLDGQSLSSAWADGSLIWLTLHSAIYFSVGLLIFSICDRIAKQRGLLGQY